MNPSVKGKRCFEIGGTPVEVDDRYEVTQMIGSGAYGIVFSAKDLKTHEEVAIKQIKTAFDSVVDAKRILREIKILSKFISFNFHLILKFNYSNLLTKCFLHKLEFFDHENIVRLVDILRPTHETNYKDVYIVTEKMEADLNRLIMSKQALSD